MIGHGNIILFHVDMKKITITVLAFVKIVLLVYRREETIFFTKLNANVHR